MTTAVLAASYLSASLLSMLVPIAAITAIVIWGVVLIRRHERHREDIDSRNRPPVAEAPRGPRSPQGG
jgi:hypothetical protein